jgi:hypothetical protein
MISTFTYTELRKQHACLIYFVKVSEWKYLPGLEKDSTYKFYCEGCTPAPNHFEPRGSQQGKL